MSSVTLLNSKDPAYDFQHAMSHRAYSQAMGELHQWSVMPYFVDPATLPDLATPASKWHQNHQQAHDDFLRALPQGYGLEGVGIPSTQILIDSNLTDSRSLAWFIHNNHMEHYYADNALLPLPNTVNQDGTPASVPWWIPAPRWTPPPYW